MYLVSSFSSAGKINAYTCNKRMISFMCTPIISCMLEVGWEADEYMRIHDIQTMYLAGGQQSTQTSKIATKSKGRIKRVFWYFQKIKKIKKYSYGTQRKNKKGVLIHRYI
jgi:hypothetical protein